MIPNEEQNNVLGAKISSGSFGSVYRVGFQNKFVKKKAHEPSNQARVDAPLLVVAGLKLINLPHIAFNRQLGPCMQQCRNLEPSDLQTLTPSAVDQLVSTLCGMVNGGIEIEVKSDSMMWDPLKQCIVFIDFDGGRPYNSKERTFGEKAEENFMNIFTLVALHNSDYTEIDMKALTFVLLADFVTVIVQWSLFKSGRLDFSDVGKHFLLTFLHEVEPGTAVFDNLGSIIFRGTMTHVETVYWIFSLACDPDFPFDLLVPVLKMMHASDWKQCVDKYAKPSKYEERSEYVDRAKAAIDAAYICI